MRILVVSALYPPVAVGGYEFECASVVDRLRERHDVLVLTGARGRRRVTRHPGIWRELALVEHDRRGTLRSPLASVHAARVAHRALAWRPDFVYVWNGALIPQAALRIIADSTVPVAFRVAEFWFGAIFVKDRFLRELLPARRGLARAAWAAGCRALNRLPVLQLDPTAPMRTAISWNSAAIKSRVEVPPFIEPVLERVRHPSPRYGDVYVHVLRRPAPEPEIVFVGRVTPVKGLVVAIEALATLRRDHDIAARLIVVGPEDRDHGMAMRMRAERLGVSELITWRGELGPEEVASVLARAHALIIPSLWPEPFGFVAIEAAFARVPIVAADVGGIGEGMHPDEHALFFPRGDSTAAAAALARILREPEQTALRVARARSRAEAFRIGPFLDEQERFVQDAFDALRTPRLDRPARTRASSGAPMS